MHTMIFHISMLAQYFKSYPNVDTFAQICQHLDDNMYLVDKRIWCCYRIVYHVELHFSFNNNIRLYNNCITTVYLYQFIIAVTFYRASSFCIINCISGVCLITESLFFRYFLICMYYTSTQV